MLNTTEMLIWFGGADPQDSLDMQYMSTSANKRLMNVYRLQISLFNKNIFPA